MRIEDITALQPNPPDFPEHHVVDPDGYVVKRKPEDITGIVIHQTGAWTELDLEQAGGDRVVAQKLAAAKLPYHVVAFTNGLVCQVKPLAWHAVHGASLNESTLGLGIEGVYGQRGAGGHEPKPITEKTLRAARMGLAHLVAKGRHSGMPLQYVYAHRQTALGAYLEDPGDEVWRRVVLEYGVPQLGLRVRPIIVYRAEGPVMARPTPLAGSQLEREIHQRNER